MKQWFVLQALTGQEQKVQRYIIAQVRNQGLSEYFDIAAEGADDEEVNSTGIVVLTERVSEVREGKKRTITRKIYPGYVFAHMALYNDDSKRTINQTVYSFLQTVPNLIGFIGGSSERPRALTDQEASDLMNQAQAQEEVAKPKIIFQLGETVRIKDGPFMSFSGVVDEIDPNRGRLKVSVSIFGRTAPVELEYWQLERFEETDPTLQYANKNNEQA